MSLKFMVLFLTIFAGSYAWPVKKDMTQAPEQDMSIFFDHTDPSARIVGGSIAGRVPYMVALTAGILFRGLMCGGSLVTTRHILTAAHCIDPLFRDGALVPSLRAVVGTNRWNTGGNMYNFAGNISHPGYDVITIKNDIGILITTTDVALSDAVALTTLNYDFIGAGVATIVTGWGRIITGGSTSPVLLQLNATVLDGNYCVEEVLRQKEILDTPYSPDVDPNTEICTFHSLGQGMCHGDSGSPLMRADLNQQIGVVSWGLPCARGAPDVFVRNSAYRQWIEENIR